MAKQLSAKAKERIQIAKDVIAQVKARRFVAECGTYVDVNRRGDGVAASVGDELSKLVKGKTCHVCAKGAFFIARLDRKNALELSRWDLGSGGNRYYGADNDLCVDYLSAAFSMEQLSIIERVFECWRSVGEENWDDLDRVVAAFEKKYPTPRARLLAIAENIIANSGTFKPETEAP